MARITYAPIVGDARGSIAGVTLSRWKTVSYARRKTRPANPNTTAQQEVRRAFTWLNDLWRYMPAHTAAAWNAQAQGKAYTGRNHFLGINVPHIIGETDITSLLMSPGMAGTNPIPELTVTPGDDQLALSALAPTLPTGWTLSAIIFGIDYDVNPQTTLPWAPQEVRDTSSTYGHTFTGLVSAHLYLVWAIAETVAPDGSTRYSVAKMSTGLTT